MGTEVSINLIWVESGYEWEVPEDWNPSSLDQSKQTYYKRSTQRKDYHAKL